LILFGNSQAADINPKEILHQVDQSRGVDKERLLSIKAEYMTVSGKLFKTA